MEASSKFYGWSDHIDRVKRIWYLSPMRGAKVQASLRIRAVSPEPSPLAHRSSESRGTFRQKARSLAPLNGWGCAVKMCHDGMLEDTNSLDGAHIHLGLNLYAWYHDASSSGSPVILFTRLLYYTKCQSRKRETIQPNIYRILPKFNQVICTLHTICKPDITILAHRVRQVFCSQGPLLAKCLKGLLPPPQLGRHINFSQMLHSARIYQLPLTNGLCCI